MKGIFKDRHICNVHVILKTRIKLRISRAVLRTKKTPKSNYYAKSHILSIAIAKFFWIDWTK